MNDFKEPESPNTAPLKASVGEVLQAHPAEAAEVERTRAVLPARRWSLPGDARLWAAAAVGLGALAGGVALLRAYQRR